MIAETTSNIKAWAYSEISTPNKPHTPQQTAMAKECERALKTHCPTRGTNAIAANMHATPTHTRSRHERYSPASVGVRENTGDMASNNNHAESKATPSGA